MSAPRSRFTKMMKQFDAQVSRYKARIDAQKETIDRLAAANAVQGDALYGIAEEAKDVRAARKIANQARDKVKVILAVPKEEAS